MPQHLEDALEPLGTDHVADADELGVLGRHADGQVSLSDLAGPDRACRHP
jgi:hypothetical protein